MFFLNFTITYYDSSKTSKLVNRLPICPAVQECPWLGVVLREQTELSRTMSLFPKKNEHIERVYKNIGTIYKRIIIERTVIV